MEEEALEFFPVAVQRASMCRLCSWLCVKVRRGDKGHILTWRLPSRVAPHMQFWLRADADADAMPCRCTVPPLSPSAALRPVTLSLSLSLPS